MKHPVRLAAGILSCLIGTQALSAPDLNGSIWYPVNPPGQIRDLSGKPPPLLPVAKATLAKHVAARKAGKLEFDTTERCLPPGLPRLLTQPMPFEFLQRDERIFIAYQWNRLVRVVDMNVPQGEVYGPQFMGQSVGKWEDDSLVIDSVGFNDSSLFDDAGAPLSEDLRLIERYRLSADGQTLNLTLTVADPKTYSKPWQTKLSFRREAGGRLAEDVCVERKGVIFWKPKK
jgi:hypothetical protein